MIIKYILFEVFCLEGLIFSLGLPQSLLKMRCKCTVVFPSKATQISLDTGNHNFWLKSPPTKKEIKAESTLVWTFKIESPVSC